ncbi:4-(cytidine 5'-diphospho)-2-C-methyl-D-erythritol kinase [Arcticibacterium luteifluviistationis]|uniref:4-diphosphocytidyl-2-C-methyl-D-erythritol kinase n=1 Tax=Arcticibacterium luteifluviistationis TaxID=1784714 RepID=A0A2Z4GAI3_9BACT|nr:4-(cytidine 5'-diphospho)-2-C-methyl-D-erythritol kinase [Arcticibacterium luteifluviistationis]AWV98085.1 4-(cytidine 5'-diphospho)-2-C-methyl-D-erythritol kinase [Arcticibacterium luteifluviistationis]
MISFPNAKINIGLNILHKREDGFHNIESVFYPIAWQDALEACIASSFEFNSSGLDIPGDTKNNLIIKAYKLLEEFIPPKEKVKIHLHKVIPMGAGLGGGSADGAFALKLLNELFKLNLSEELLESMAGKLGSDCPFFIQNKPVFCYDRGIKFKEIDLDLSSYKICVVNPNIHISTAEAYGAITTSLPKNALMDAIKKPIAAWKGIITNDFEEPLAKKYPKIGAIKKQLYTLGACYASMTGSGSTVYGIFDKEIDTKKHFEGLTTWQGQML